MPDNTIRGRFAPSPSGRLHLGNMLTFLLAWLDVRHAAGRWCSALRISTRSAAGSTMLT